MRRRPAPRSFWNWCAGGLVGVDSTPQLPYDSVRRVHTDQTKWCLDSAVVSIAHSWQEGSSFEFVNLLVGAIPDRDCSTEVFGAYRPRHRMRPTVLQF